VDNDKPAFLKAIAKGVSRGTLRDNSRRKPSAPKLAPEPALSDD
jgi:hypothetical protein